MLKLWNLSISITPLEKTLLKPSMPIQEKLHVPDFRRDLGCQLVMLMSVQSTQRNNAAVASREASAMWQCSAISYAHVCTEWSWSTLVVNQWTKHAQIMVCKVRSVIRYWCEIWSEIFFPGICVCNQGQVHQLQKSSNKQRNSYMTFNPTDFSINPWDKLHGRKKYSIRTEALSACKSKVS